ncbi:unnamed protein product [Clonostachys rosea]|uniref:DUF8035 domain-containing protein n=1 Tax=Bionectria ochroleuca TaxID=29856 RepID=A0ABY6UUS4_BIOOC|nr:unnamed protein product [Clonostachys rosea]
MSGTSTPEQRIHIVDTFACTLFHRIKQHPTQNDIADIIGELHGSLRRLTVEASDLNSLLRDPRSAYSGQLLSVINDCDGTLRHLQYTLDHQGRALGVIRSQLWNRISSISRLIDAVQMQNRGMHATPRPPSGRGRGGRRPSQDSVPRSTSGDDYSYYPTPSSSNPMTAAPPIPPKIPLDKPYNQVGDPSTSESDNSSYSYILTTSIATNDAITRSNTDPRFARSSSRSQPHHRRGNSLPIARIDTPYMSRNSYGSTNVSELPGSTSFSTQSGPFPSSPSHKGPAFGSGLAPDRHGQPIPLDAEWTKIDRDIVSPGVLELSGVRYEARPSYVAVLGRLSKDQVSAFARQTANYRAGRPIQPEDWHLSGATERTPKTRRRTSDSSDSSKAESISSRGTVDPRRKRASTTSDVPPKSVLKKRSMNRVRFDPNPEEIKPKTSSVQGNREKAHPNRSQSYDERNHIYELSGGSPSRRPRSASRAGSFSDRPRSYSYDVDRDYYSPSSGYDDFDQRSYRGDGRRRRLSISGTANRLLSALSSSKGSSQSQSRRERDLAY